MKEKTAKYLLKKVQKDYENISEEFSNTRKYAWPEFKFFGKYLKNDLTIIDLGCGNGRLYNYLQNLQNLDYIGIDNNKNFIHLAQNSYPRTKFLFGSFLNPPRVHKADILFNIASLHHVPSKKLRFKSIHNIKQLLKNDGICITIVWNLYQKRYYKYILRSLFKFFILFGKYDWNDTFIPWGNTHVKRYYHAFTPKEIKNLFEKNGFEILEMFYTNKDKKVSFFNSRNICLICKMK